MAYCLASTLEIASKPRSWGYRPRTKRPMTSSYKLRLTSVDLLDSTSRTPLSSRTAYDVALSVRFPPACSPRSGPPSAALMFRLRRPTLSSAGKFPPLRHISRNSSDSWWCDMSGFLDIHKCMYTGDGFVRQVTKL